MKRNLAPARLAVTIAASLALVAAGSATAQVTPALQAKIKAIGRFVDPPSTALVYGPLQPKPPYPGVKVTRDVKYGPDARNILDVFTPEKPGAKRPVLIFVPGGAGNKIEPVPMGSPFYDNVMLWAVKNGMTGVNIQRRSELGEASARDVGEAIAWVKKNIATYGGDPSRVYIWGHSAGAMSLAIYLAHPDYYPAGGAGVKGAVLMAGAYNVAPLKVDAPPLQVRMGMDAKPITMTPPPGAPPPPPEVMMQTAVLPGLTRLSVPLYLSAAELDPEQIVGATKVLNKALCDAGKCPTFEIYKHHGHMSQIFAVNTPDVSTSGPVLRFFRGLK